jgi:acyl-CoA synthetase (AMP-forming)/AMP-acid ligase II
VAGSSSLLWDAFESRTGNLGEQVAVEAPGIEIDFGEMWKLADRLAALFLEAGVREGGVAGLALGNSPLFPVAFLALCRLDTTVALLPPQYGRTELKAIADGVGLSSIVAEAEAGPRIMTAIPIASASAAEGLRVLVPASAKEDAGATDEGEALLKFSSGSTGEPKGIALTAENVLAEAENVRTTLDLGRGDRILAGVPLFHSYGFDLGVLPTLYSGATLLLEDSFVPRRTMRRLAYRVAAFLGVPAHYRAFLATRIDKTPDFSAVRWLLSCTAPLAPEAVTEFLERFGAPICQHYGSSETGAVTTHLPSEVRGRPGSVGRPMSGVEVSVVEGGRAVTPGSVGEVVVESGAVARRYVLGAPPSPSPLRDGVFRTGDIGRVDSDGFLTLVGRRDTMINVGGLKVSPAEVSTTLERHSAVREAVVLGLPDGRDEEVVYAVVALSEPVGEEELLDLCREALAEHKVPRRIEIRDELPRTATGKVRLGVEDLQA